MKAEQTETQRQLPRRSFAGLNAANFFQAEMVGVVLPVLSAYLKEAGWRYDQIGIAAALAGFGTLVLQTPAGWITDRVSCRRLLFAILAIATGLSLGVIAIVPKTLSWDGPLLFVSGAAQSFFGPLLGALALALAGHQMLNRTMGANQAWNHAGNIVAAAAAIAVVKLFGLTAVFYSVAACSILAAVSVLWVREGDLDERIARGLTSDEQKEVPWRELFRDRTILYLFISIFLFHLANAPIMPATALYVKKLGGSDDLMTATVLTAQVVMVPVALFSGRLCDSWGRKAVMLVAFWVLPARIFSYSLATTLAQ